MDCSFGNLRETIVHFHYSLSLSTHTNIINESPAQVTYESYQQKVSDLKKKISKFFWNHILHLLRLFRMKFYGFHLCFHQMDTRC